MEEGEDSGGVMEESERGMREGGQGKRWKGGVKDK